MHNAHTKLFKLSEDLLERKHLPSGRFPVSWRRAPFDVLKFAKEECWASLEEKGRCFGRSNSSKRTSLGSSSEGREIRGVT